MTRSDIQTATVSGSTTRSELGRALYSIESDWNFQGIFWASSQLLRVARKTHGGARAPARAGAGQGPACGFDLTRCDRPAALRPDRRQSESRVGCRELARLPGSRGIDPRGPLGRSWRDSADLSGVWGWDGGIAPLADPTAAARGSRRACPSPRRASGGRVGRSAPLRPSMEARRLRSAGARSRHSSRSGSRPVCSSRPGGRAASTPGFAGRLASMRVALFIPCYVDQLRPEVGLATLDVLEALGIETVFPEDQTCCGQPFLTALGQLRGHPPPASAPPRPRGARDGGGRSHPRAL
jgi:hypothetical protein